MIRKYSLSLRGHRTSLSLEVEFWDALGRLAKRENVTRTTLIARIDEQRGTRTLSSALRVHVLNAFLPPAPL